MIPKPVSSSASQYRWALEQLMLKLVTRRYSESTQRCYHTAFRAFLAYVYPLPLHHVHKEHIYKYHAEMIRKQHISRSTQNQSINAIKFYLEHVLVRYDPPFGGSYYQTLHLKAD